MLIHSYRFVKIVKLKFPISRELFFLLVSLDFEARTKKMRAILLVDVRMKDHLFNSSQVAVLVAAVVQGDARILG